MKYVNNRLLTNHQKLSFIKQLLQITDRKYKRNYINFKQLTELQKTS